MAGAKSSRGENIAENTPLVRLPHSTTFPPAVSLRVTEPRVSRKHPIRGRAERAERAERATTTRR